MLQFADIARPWMGGKPRHRALGNPLVSDPPGLADAPREVLRQQRDVLAAFSERRKLQCHHVEAVVEVLAETPLLDGQLDVRVGGGDDADIHAAGRRVAESSELTRLQRPEELGLEGG